jgi:hypothetical protein
MRSLVTDGVLACEVQYNKGNFFSRQGSARANDSAESKRTEQSKRRNSEHISKQ